MNKLTLMTGFAVGYVLGAKAGTSRYDQIMGKADEFMGKPKVQKATDTISKKASDLTEKAKDTVNEKVESVTSSAAPSTSPPPSTGPAPSPSTSPAPKATTTPPKAPMPGAAASGAAPDVSMSTGATGATTSNH